MRYFPLGLALLASAAYPTIGVGAQVQARDLGSGARATLLSEWVQFETGADESAQSLQVRVWGTLRDSSFFAHGFQQLDRDPELEYVIISRNDGTGPYYKLQIIDQNPHGILTWSYDSYERPRITDARVDLGLPPRDGRAPARALYHLTPQGLQAGAP